MRGYLFLLAFLIYLFFAPISIFAQVVINEFCPQCDPEWVELFNSSEQAVDLDGWEIQDGNTKTTDDLTITGIINSKSFLVFEHPKGWLNDSYDSEKGYCDIVKLFNNTDNPDPLDSVSYSSVAENLSYSRIPDGTGDFIANTNISPNSFNQTPPTSIPTDMPTVTSTPSPTCSTTPSPISKVTASSLTSTITPTPTPIPISVTLSMSVSPASSTSSFAEAEVLSETTSSSDLILYSENGDSVETASSSVEKEKTRHFNLIVIALGLVSLGGGIFIFRLKILPRLG